ncbi:EPS-associated transcriptional regulator, MarR family [Nereida ignava]|jgi:EPS-associated MarR family transcriptional regulator|uniref:EPS-associated transcriptional regulator, MarR family n=1 Tax=Nereida ignava TaxID=282199 RepID=A0A0U1NPH8_9RHOB|nr:MarR family EPS-associated transcriptional regulator [Nereida ignava]CRK76638.1 EPS-associated transcriptional regulator, MarR family [Nereida ignava]SFJ38759.1 EPS-associated transcriptional regulator, MarR family [Nereida ignava DSM 16309]
MASRRHERQAETRLQVMRLIAQNPEMSTRQIAERAGISNGSAYYVLTALVEKGFVKLGNFASNPRKGQYAHLLTPKGIREKSLLTHSFIERKREEFAALQAEIEALEREAGLAGEAAPFPQTGPKETARD